jgi:hypothetical protein
MTDENPETERPAIGVDGTVEGLPLRLKSAREVLAFGESEEYLRVISGAAGSAQDPEDSPPPKSSPTDTLGCSARPHPELRLRNAAACAEEPKGGEGEAVVAGIAKEAPKKSAPSLLVQDS